MQLSHRRGRPASRAQPLTSGSLHAPPTWAGAPSSLASPGVPAGLRQLGPRVPHEKPAVCAEGARGARYDAQAGRAPPIPLRPPRRLTRGRGRGGGGSCLRLTVKSDSCSRLARASPGPASSPPPSPAAPARRPPSPQPLSRPPAARD